MKINNINSNLSFFSTSRNYVSSSGDKFGCYSCLYRDDVDWNKLAKYESEHFADKDKVNIIMYASSDGSEAYTKIMSIFENMKGEHHSIVKKYFPIRAYDVDNEILKAAKSGFIRTSLMDRVELSVNTVDYDDYFESSSEKFEIKDDKKIPSEQILRAKKILTDNVEFNYGDMFQKITEIKDDSNTVIMCRNILGYFMNGQINSFIQATAKSLKTGSLLVIGGYDYVMYNIKHIIESHNFQEVMNNVYKKL